MTSINSNEPNMPITQLPEDIFPAHSAASCPLIIHPYTAPVGAFRGRSMLNWNAISLVISGEKILHFAEKSVRVNENEFHILSAGNCIVTMNMSEKKPFSSILIFFSTLALEDFCLKYDEKIKQATLAETVAPQAYLAFEKDAFVLSYMNSLQVLLQTAPSVSCEMKQLKFEELLLYLLSKYPERLLGFLSNKAQKAVDLLIRKAAETAVSNPISVEDLSFICNMSISTFKRNFIKIYGIPPNQWLIKKRIELAKHYLIHHCIKPGEVFHQIGYENHASFSKKFKEIVGMTPREFQTRHFQFERKATVFE